MDVGEDDTIDRFGKALDVCSCLFRVGQKKLTIEHDEFRRPLDDLRVSEES